MYKAILTHTFEALGAEWVFRADDSSLARFMKAAREEGTLTFDADTVPLALVDELCGIFDAGVIGWSGVVDAAGKPLPFDLEAAVALPTMHKVQVASAYLAAVTASDAEMGGSDEPPTGTTPPSAMDGPKATTPP